MKKKYPTNFFKIEKINKNYKDIEPNFIEIKYVGKIEKSNLILIHTKGGREYTCIFLPTEQEIYKELRNFISF